MSLDCEKKPEHTEEIHAGMKKACKLHSDRPPVKWQACLPSCSEVTDNHYTTISPSEDDVL